MQRLIAKAYCKGSINKTYFTTTCVFILNNVKTRQEQTKTKVNREERERERERERDRDRDRDRDGGRQRRGETETESEREGIIHWAMNSWTALNVNEFILFDMAGSL